MYDTLNEFHKPIMICEANISPHEAYDEDDPATWDNLAAFCKDAYSKPNVIGCIFYEMCDQMNFETDVYESEAHFGFIYADKYGNMTGEKAAYDRFRKICGGVKKPTVMIESTENDSGESVRTWKPLILIPCAVIVMIAATVTVLTVKKKKTERNPR